jgi:hypothetical protein
MGLGVIKDLRKIYSGLNADEIRGAAHRDVDIGLMAASEDGYRAMEHFLAPAILDDYARAEALRSIHRIDAGTREQYDLVLCEPGIPAPPHGYVFNPADPALTAQAIAADYHDIELAIARRFPGLRKAAASRMIHRVSRENAMFSLVTALPNVIPTVLDLPWAVGEFATDTAFLTMNQIRMALMMAAAHAHTVGYAEQKAQIAVIVAGAFGWRALARELVGKIPLGGGLIPKAAVAYAGTYVVGMGLEKMHSTGIGLTGEEKKDAYADAFAKGKEVVQEMAPTIVKRG